MVKPSAWSPGPLVRLFRDLSRKRWIYWSIVLLLAIISWVSLSAISGTSGRTREIAVASRLILPGQNVSESIRILKRSEVDLPNGAIEPAELNPNLVASQPIYANEVLVSERIVSEIQFEGGVVAIPAEANLRPQLRAGDKVDLVATVSEGSSTVAKGAVVTDLKERSVSLILRQQDIAPTVTALNIGRVTLVLVGG